MVVVVFGEMLLLSGVVGSVAGGDVEVLLMTKVDEMKEGGMEVEAMLIREVAKVRKIN